MLSCAPALGGVTPALSRHALCMAAGTGVIQMKADYVVSENRNRLENATMKALIKKYRQAKELADAEDYQIGMDCGTEWATKSDPLPYAELRNLAAAREGLELNGYDDCDFLAGILLGCDELDYGVVDSFFGDAMGENWFRLASKPAFLRGFCEAAIEVWDEVSPHPS